MSSSMKNSLAFSPRSHIDATVGNNNLTERSNSSNSSAQQLDGSFSIDELDVWPMAGPDSEVSKSPAPNMHMPRQQIHPPASIEQPHSHWDDGRDPHTSRPMGGDQRFLKPQYQHQQHQQHSGLGEHGRYSSHYQASGPHHAYSGGRGRGPPARGRGPMGRGRGGEARRGVGQGYRRLWMQITQVGRGQKLGDGDSIPFSEMTVEDLLKIVRNLAPEASAVKAISDGLYYLDSGALAGISP